MRPLFYARNHTFPKYQRSITLANFYLNDNSQTPISHLLSGQFAQSSHYHFHQHKVGQMSENEGFSLRDFQKKNAYDYENAFYWFSHPTRINKLLAHYDLYQKILGLPGDILELGVFKATSLIRLATFRNLLENDYSRKIVGFDAFGEFPRNELSLESDLKFIDHFETTAGSGLTKEEVTKLFELKNFGNISLNKGNVFETIPTYLKENPATRIAFLHLDMDVKEPTIFALNALYDRVVPNGLIVFDDYNSVAGETDAVDEFLAQKKLSIQKTHHYYIPAFIQKPI